MNKKTTAKSKNEPLFETMSEKNEVVKFEAGNYDKIALYRSGPFWAATENSCLYLVNIFKIKNKLHVTFDKFFNRERIYISCHDTNLKKMQDLLKNGGCEVIRDDERIKLYRLPKQMSAEDLKTWRRNEDIKNKKIDAYFLPDSGETKIYSLLRALGHEVVVGGEKMRQSARELIGGKLLMKTVDLFSYYTHIEESKNIGEIAAIKKEMLMLVHEFSFLSTISHGYGLIEDKRMMRMGVILKDLSKELGLDKKKSEEK